VSEEFPITPKTKIAALLEHYPQLEPVLVAMAPPFKKLKNPILRRSVAKVASLRQAAAVGRIPVLDMINQLRAVVGQEPIAPKESREGASYFESRPAWFEPDKIVESINEKDVDPDVMPLNPLIRRANRLEGAQILELITTYLPAPGIDIMKTKGFLVWCVEDDRVIRTYFAKPGPGR